MTSPDGSRGSSPLRVGGLALLGVGVVAGILGVVGLNSGGGTPPPVAAPSLSTAAAPSESAERRRPHRPPRPRRPRSRPPRRPPPLRPPPRRPPPAAAAARTARRRRVRRGPLRRGRRLGRRLRLRGRQRPTAPGWRCASTTTARSAAWPPHAADDFRGAGWTVDAVANYPSSEGIIPTSTVYFRPGHRRAGLRGAHRQRVRAARRAPLRRADRRQPGADRHRHQRLPEALTRQDRRSA